MRKFTSIIMFFLISFIQSILIQKLLQNNRKYLEAFKCSVVYYIDDFKNIPQEIHKVNRRC